MGKQLYKVSMKYLLKNENRRLQRFCLVAFCFILKCQWLKFFEGTICQYTSQRIYPCDSFCRHYRYSGAKQFQLAGDSKRDNTVGLRLIVFHEVLFLRNCVISKMPSTSWCEGWNNKLMIVSCLPVSHYGLQDEKYNDKTLYLYSHL